MHDLVSKLDNEDIVALCGMLVGVVAILGGITVAVTKVVSSHYRRSQMDEMEATLKMEMIQRGMPADDIMRVLGARMDSTSSSKSFGLRLKGLAANSPRVFTQECKEG